MSEEQREPARQLFERRPTPIVRPVSQTAFYIEGPDAFQRATREVVDWMRVRCTEIPDGAINGELFRVGAGGSYSAEAIGLQTDEVHLWSAILEDHRDSTNGRTWVTEITLGQKDLLAAFGARLSLVVRSGDAPYYPSRPNCVYQVLQHVTAKIDGQEVRNDAHEVNTVSEAKDFVEFISQKGRRLPVVAISVTNDGKSSIDADMAYSMDGIALERGCLAQLQYAIRATKIEERSPPTWELVFNRLPIAELSSRVSGAFNDGLRDGNSAPFRTGRIIAIPDLEEFRDFDQRTEPNPLSRIRRGGNAFIAATRLLLLGLILDKPEVMGAANRSLSVTVDEERLHQFLTSYYKVYIRYCGFGKAGLTRRWAWASVVYTIAAAAYLCGYAIVHSTNVEFISNGILQAWGVGLFAGSVAATLKILLDISRTVESLEFLRSLYGRNLEGSELRSFYNSGANRAITSNVWWPRLIWWTGFVPVSVLIIWDAVSLNCPHGVFRGCGVSVYGGALVSVTILGMFRVGWSVFKNALLRERLNHIFRLALAAFRPKQYI